MHKGVTVKAWFDWLTMIGGKPFVLSLSKDALACRQAGVASFGKGLGFLKFK